MKAIEMYKIILLTCLLNCVHSSKVRSFKDAQDYLRSFGYLRSPETDSGVSSYSFGNHGSSESGKMKTFKEGLSVFQHMVGITPTGLLDNETMVMMNKPRCGMAERMELTENRNMNRKMLSHKIPPTSRRWETSIIHYKIESFPRNASTLDSVIVRNEIQRAFRLWERVSNIQCIELTENDGQTAEIDINFVMRAHGDGSAFGDVSVGNVVAHAFFPDHHHFEGDIHFDNERPWTAYHNQGINLYQIAAHEIGHALGLDHSKFPDAVMHMIVHGDLKNNFKLHEDDIKGIQNLYGIRRQKGKTLHPNQKQKQHQSNNHAAIASTNSMNRYIAEQPEWGSTEKSEAEMVQGKLMMGDSETGNDLESTLSGFWECFGLSYEPRSSKSTTDCYTRNVLKFLSSIQV